MELRIHRVTFSYFLGSSEVLDFYVLTCSFIRELLYKTSKSSYSLVNQHYSIPQTVDKNIMC